MKKMLAVCMAVIFFFALLPSGEARAELPKGKTIAVLVKGTSHAPLARSILIRALLDEGYKAVDEKQLERIRQNKAAILALEGNVEAIMALGRTFGFSVLLSGSVAVPSPVRNEFGLFTATATVSATACTASNARQVAAGSASANRPSGTSASMPAVEAAASSAASDAGPSAISTAAKPPAFSASRAPGPSEARTTSSAPASRSACASFSAPGPVDSSNAFIIKPIIPHDD